MSVELHKEFARAERYRNTGDYDFFTVFTKDQANAQIELAKEFIELGESFFEPHTSDGTSQVIR